jgi:hypothetical protein
LPIHDSSETVMCRLVRIIRRIAWTAVTIAVTTIAHCYNVREQDFPE